MLALFPKALTPRSRRVRSLVYNSIGAEGAASIAEALKTNSALKDLKCAARARFSPLSAAADTA